MAAGRPGRLFRPGRLSPQFRTRGDAVEPIDAQVPVDAVAQALRHINQAFELA